MSMGDHSWSQRGKTCNENIRFLERMIITSQSTRRTSAMTTPKLQSDEPVQCGPRSRQRTKCPFRSLELLKNPLPRHIRSTHYFEDAPPTCTQCGITFNRKDSLERHRREQHSDDSNVVCDLCKSFVGRRRLHEHRYSQKCKTARLPEGGEG